MRINTTYSGDPTDALAWLRERPRLLADNPPSDLSRCACGRGTVLVVIDSPSGPYAVCPSCIGRDLELRGPRTPDVIPVRPTTTKQRKAT